MPELEKVVDLLNQLKRELGFKVLDDTQIRRILKKMISLKGLEYYIEMLKIFNILLYIEYLEKLSNLINRSDNFSENREKINNLYEYVFQYNQEGVKLKDAYAMLNIAPSSFCRFFKKITNLTFMEYVKRVRVGIAAKILAETDKQITQICF